MTRLPPTDAPDDTLPAVREAASEELPSLGRLLAQAYADDPVHCYTLPEAGRREVVAALFFGRLLRTLRERGRRVLVTEALTSVAVWASFPEARQRPGEDVRYLPEVVARGPLARSSVIFEFAESLHPATPHWYLELVATQPSLQGRGLGTAVTAPILQDCDDRHLPAWTWSSNSRNLSFYRRLGFTSSTVAVPGTPLTLHPVVRLPSPRLA